MRRGGASGTAAGLALLAGAAAAAEGPVQLLACDLELPAALGAGGEIALAAGTMTLVDVAVLGERGRVEVEMVRLGEGLARVRIRAYAYERPVAEGTGAQSVTGEATFLLVDGEPCAAEGCARFAGAIDAELARSIFGAVLAALGSPKDCRPIWPPRAE